MLLEKIEELLLTLPDNEQEYKDYLEASKADIPACHAGYFAQDNSESDEAIANEVAEILHNKKGLISLRKEDGSFNTRRFLFSKWTLKEGWDNPNVFTIAKLRSSGSDNSKLQEVGRGLRLPVDEMVTVYLTRNLSLIILLTLLKLILLKDLLMKLMVNYQKLLLFLKRHWIKWLKSEALTQTIYL